jgi:hypothetical protein
VSSGEFHVLASQAGDGELDRGQWGAQVVADRGQEGAAQPVRRGQRPGLASLVGQLLLPQQHHRLIGDRGQHPAVVPRQLPAGQHQRVFPISGLADRVRRRLGHRGGAHRAHRVSAVQDGHPASAVGFPNPVEQSRKVAAMEHRPGEQVEQLRLAGGAARLPGPPGSGVH